MIEYIGEAVVLTKEPEGDLNSRVALFTKQFGKLTAKAKSARKITSKLGPHLEPGNLVQVRLVEKRGLQVVDALKKSSLDIKPSELFFLEKLLAEAEPDQGLWRIVVHGGFNWRHILKVLGWDPNAALCQICKSATPNHFHLKDQDFFCANCVFHQAKNELLYIGD